MNPKPSRLDVLIKHHAKLYSDISDYVVKIMRLRSRLLLYEARGLSPDDSTLSHLEFLMDDLSSLEDEFESLQEALEDESPGITSWGSSHRPQGHQLGFDL